MTNAEVIENFDNTIAGAGTIRGANLTLHNFGTINANSNGQTLTIVSSSNVDNSGGTLEATNFGVLHLAATVAGSGGAILVNTHGVLEIDANQTNDVTFGSDATGVLQFDHTYDLSSGTFTGTIAGLVLGDTIDLVGTIATDAIISTVGSQSTFTVQTTAGTLTYHIAGVLIGNGFEFGTDGNGGTDLVLEVEPTIVSVTDNVSPVTGVVAAGGVTNDNTPTARVSLAGTDAVAGDSVQLYNGSVAVGGPIVLTSTDIANQAIDITPSALSQGTYNFNARILDAAGTGPASPDYTITIDTTTPTGGTPNLVDASDWLVAHRQRHRHYGSNV